MAWTLRIHTASGHECGDDDLVGHNDFTVYHGEEAIAFEGDTDLTWGEIRKAIDVMNRLTQFQPRNPRSEHEGA